MDQEMIAYFDEHFRETARQISENSQQIVGLREEMIGRFEQVDGRFEQVGGRFEGVEGRLGGLEEAVRHNHVSLEGLRGEVRLVAEGVTNTNERLDTFKAEVAQEFTETRKMIRLGYSDLDRRVRALEARRERPDQDPTEPL